MWYHRVKTLKKAFKRKELMDACEQEMDFKKKKNHLYVVFIPNDILSQTADCRLFKKIKIKKSPVMLQFLRMSASN